MWFQYPDKLNQDLFRIFTLEPGRKHDKIQGSLETHHLDAVPKYEALSYEWGSKTETTSIKCNNLDFKITKSLDITLRRLRLTDKPRSLWIDQICIDQESDDERSAQVSIMRLIYSNANMVIAWLGPADIEAANSVKDLLTTFMNLKEENYACGLSHFPDDAHLARLNLPLRASRVWKDLDSMLRASYFSRVWIIQELAISSKFELLWGDITISEDEFKSLQLKIFWLCMIPVEGGGDCPSFGWDPGFMTFFGKGEWEDKDLLKLVQWASASKATIPQDKIYALIGLAGQHHYDVNPDYSKPESEVFADFATRVISTNKNLDILDWAHVEDSNEPKHLPLWAPRWQPADYVMGFLNGEFRASKETKAIIKLPSDVNILELRGVEVGAVKDVHPNQRSGSNPVLELHYNVAAALKMVKKHNGPFEQTYKLDAIKVIILTMMAGRKREILWLPTPKRPEDESYLDDFIRFAAATMVKIMHSIGYDTELFDLIQLVLEVRGPVLQDEQDEPHIGYTAEEQSILDRIRWKYPDNPEYVCTAQDLIMLCKPVKKMQDCASYVQSISLSKGLNFFIMGNGYVGVGPRCMKTGDKVCILFGGSTPYVIRPTSIADEYLYLGPAYVHGIMDGEVIDWEEHNDSEDQEFSGKFFKLL